MVETLTQLLDTYGLLAIFVVMLVKEIGVPVPIPADLIMLVAAAQAAAGRYETWLAFGLILAAMVVGASIQYMLVRRLGRAFLERFGRYVGLTAERLDRAAGAVRKGGAVTVGISLTTPGLRIATVPACGLAELPYLTFLPGVIAGSGVFLLLHFAIGFVGGPLVESVLHAVNLPVLAFIAAFLLVGLAGWLLLRRRARMRRLGAAAVTAERLRDWTDACCPVCLALGAAESARQRIHNGLTD